MSYSSHDGAPGASERHVMGGPPVNDDDLEEPPRALSPAIMDLALSSRSQQMLPSEAAAARRLSDPMTAGDPLFAADVYSRSLLSQSYNAAERFFLFPSPNAASLSPMRRRMEAAAEADVESPGIDVGGANPADTYRSDAPVGGDDVGGPPAVLSSASGTATPLTSNLALLLASQSEGVGEDPADDGTGGDGGRDIDVDVDEEYVMGLGANQHTPRPGEPILKRPHHTYSPESDLDSASVSVSSVAKTIAEAQESTVAGASGGSAVSFAPINQEILSRRPPPTLGSSAPGRFLLPPGVKVAVGGGEQRQWQQSLGGSQSRPPPPVYARAASVGAQSATGKPSLSADSALLADDTVRRCQSVFEMRRGNIASTSYSGGGIVASSPAHSNILQKKQTIEATLQERLSQRREASMKELLQAQNQMRRLSSQQSSRTQAPTGEDLNHSPASHSSSTLRMTNNRRKCRRAEHNRAVIRDLCEIVVDLCIAESKLLFHSAQTTSLSAPSAGGIAGLLDGASPDRKSVLSAVAAHLNDLPVRYALGVDSPSEVLLHMRLMTSARADPTRAAVHIGNVDDGDSHVAAGTIHPGSTLRLVTICCADCGGLLEFISKLLGTGGARVLDADVMLTSDSIALDRFVVEMKGRLRLDKLQQYVESYLQEARNLENADLASTDENGRNVVKKTTTPLRPPKASESVPILPSFPSQTKLKPRAGSISAIAYGGAVYFHPPKRQNSAPRRLLREEIQAAVPLSRLVSSSSTRNQQEVAASTRPLRQPPPHDPTSSQSSDSPKTSGQSTGEDSSSRSPPTPPVTPPRSAAAAARRRSQSDVEGNNRRQHQMLVNREAVVLTNSPEHGTGTLPEDDASSGPIPPSGIAVALHSQPRNGRDRTIPFIPFDELMLIETLGTGRCTIYRAAWQMPQRPNSPAIVALKVATVDPNTAETSCVEELRHEADIAAMLEHKNICKMVGIASDPECFCLAYEYCEGGSLMSLLSDASRYYEYLPIALDIANGMAYLHSQAILHRDLKPSNVLLTNNKRAKISDFGMSVALTGQELTAETGTYRWMAPEVIKHESYSSNADVYSFGIVLWQLITVRRNIPRYMKCSILLYYTCVTYISPPRKHIVLFPTCREKFLLRP